MTQRCARVWMAEAARDGRVDTPTMESFRKHAAKCAVCVEEVRRLERVGAAVRAMRVNGLDELTVRRRRQDLLARLDIEATALPKTRMPWLIPSAAIVLLAGIGLALSIGGPKASNRPAASALMLHVRPVDARWSTHHEGSKEVIVLEDGQLEIESAGQNGVQGLVVRVPDGEIEDIGTHFVVSVRSEETQSIEVSEGAVVFHATRSGDHFLRAGERWRGIGSAAASVEAARASEVEPSPSEPMKPRSSTHSPSTKRLRSSKTTTSIPELAASANLPNAAAAGDLFARGMTALRFARYPEAEEALEQFIHAFPGDPRGEDASFLRAVAASKLGDSERAARLAREYLVRYPAGLRHQEAEALVRGVAP